MTNKGVDILKKDYKIKKEIFLIHLHELLASEIEVGIGFLAGQIFGLTLKEEKSLTQIKYLLDQNEKVVLMALGWLAREDKVLCRFDSDELFVRSIK